MAFDLLIIPVNLRRAWLINRAWRPIWESPISPSISACGVKAATESTITKSTAFERTSVSVISNACSPLSGWETNKFSVSTPRRLAYAGSSACSASINAAVPPCFWISAIAWSVNVVLPELSGPYISMIRPFGYPPPSAKSKLKAPEGITSTSTLWASPNFIIDPSPNCLVIWSIARPSALSLPSSTFLSDAWLDFSGFTVLLSDFAIAFPP